MQESKNEILIFVPTYNERENAPLMATEIAALGIAADILFVDDNSPDGTGQLLDSLRPSVKNLIVHHRDRKRGIGSAHSESILWAYNNGYKTFVSLDCDFTHSPSDIPALIEKSRHFNVAVGSRWVNENSLPGWNLYRRAMTLLGHALTRKLLGLPYDATSAFRAYDLKRIPSEVFRLVRSTHYSFFYESLFILYANKFSISENPIILPARTYGSSKMSGRAAMESALNVFSLAWRMSRQPADFTLKKRLT